MRRYRKGLGLPGVYRGKLHNQRNPRAVCIPRISISLKPKTGLSKIKFYYGPPEKQKDPWAINMYNPKKNKEK